MLGGVSSGPRSATRPSRLSTAYFLLLSHPRKIQIPFAAVFVTNVLGGRCGSRILSLVEVDKTPGMVQPVNAMAMFMLRLAGLISLENAIQQQEVNQSVLASLSTAYYNESHLANMSRFADMDQSMFANLSLPSLNRSLSANLYRDNDNQSTLTNLSQASFNQSNSTIRHRANISQSSFPNRSKLSNSEVRFDTLFPHSTTGFSPTPEAKENGGVEDHGEGLRREGRGYGGGRERMRGVLTEERDTEGRERRREESERSEEEEERERHVGMRVEEEGVIEMLPTPMALTASRSPDQVNPNTSPSYDEPRLQTMHRRDEREPTEYRTPTTQSLVPPPTHLPRRTPLIPRLESLIEEDSTAGIIDGQKLATMQASSEDPTTSSFQYLDAVTSANVLPRPTLSSRSLVGAVPPRSMGPPIMTHSSDGSSQHLGTTSSSMQATIYTSQESQDGTEVPGNPSQITQPRTRKLPPARPIPPGFYQPQQQPTLRNNPYPYGPRLLPGPYAPFTPNLPPASDGEEEESREAVVEYNYEEYYEGEGTEPFSGFEVQTREPAVLFIFDKPGYSPEPPTTMAPPTRAPTPSDPWECTPRCPSYTLLDWNMEYDVRLYPATLWVSTVIISDNRVLAELEGYMRVQDYYYGLNDQGLVLNLTVPFITQVKLGRHPGVLQETNDYTISLYVQPGYYIHSELPTPISNEVLVDELEEKTVFVHSFEANVWEVTENFLREKVEALMTQLRHNGEAFLDRYYYLASYSRPELYQMVYYEVWIYATNFRDPQTSAKSISPSRRPQTNKITEKTLNKLCRGVECPNFEVLRTYKYGIQKRRYFNGLFASTSPNECQFTTMSVWKGFMPLHLYKHGINSHMEVIEATRPIALVHVRDSRQPDTECPQNLTMSLYLPSRLHSNPPVTGYAAPIIRITTMENVIVYAYTVGGYLLDPDRVRQELSDMKYRLSEFGACYKDDEHYVVIYDFIVRYHGRQNEIWIVAENCKATPNG
ncbi:hypothetical protein Pmani_021824 [Petrolisthes manimaculis]|uniref:Uncharacterized protein n=1 Tax=Petrolisthes manimaculis TaxID=1843537 RepID=A0AAE1U1A3_9EUCA|nr:hypothetical protein Pmani_021824 [Petrolisthes manimaculis]